MKKWQVGLQQNVIICDGCKCEAIEDEMQWSMKGEKIYCENCADKMGLRNAES